MTAAADPNCIFCKIATGAIPAPKLHEDDRCFAIRDIRPLRQHHYLVIPKAHVASLEQAFPAGGAGQGDLVGCLFKAGTEVARKQGLLPDGFRAVINTGAGGGQTVFHLHLHILAGPRTGEESIDV